MLILPVSLNLYLSSAELTVTVYVPAFKFLTLNNVATPLEFVFVLYVLVFLPILILTLIFTFLWNINLFFASSKVHIFTLNFLFDFLINSELAITYASIFCVFWGVGVEDVVLVFVVISVEFDSAFIFSPTVSWAISSIFSFSNGMSPSLALNSPIFSEAETLPIQTIMKNIISIFF